MGAVVSVNALGDVYDFESGKKLRGMTCGRCDHELYRIYDEFAPVNSNTTIACLITNGAFSKAEMSKNRLNGARRLCALHIAHRHKADGDTIFGAWFWQ